MTKIEISGPDAKVNAYVAYIIRAHLQTQCGQLIMACPTGCETGLLKERVIVQSKITTITDEYVK